MVNRSLQKNNNMGDIFKQDFNQKSPEKCDVSKQDIKANKNTANHAIIDMEENSTDSNVCHKTYKCGLCDETCMSVSSFIEHIRTHPCPEKNETGHLKGSAEEKSMNDDVCDRTYTCGLCYEKCTSESSFIEHLRTHPWQTKNKKPRMCSLPENDLKGQKNKTDHLMNSEEEKSMDNNACDKTYTCGLCYETCMSESSFIEHIGSHSWQKRTKYPEMCNSSQNNLKGKENKAGHLMSSASAEEKSMDNNVCPKTYACGFCYEMCTSKSSFIEHLRNHPCQKSFRCNICEKTFVNMGAHIGVHEIKTEPIYVCTVCKKGFDHKGSLKLHLKIHSEERPYKCEICQKTFVRKGNLKTHFRIHIEEKKRKVTKCFYYDCERPLYTNKERPFLCEICRETFSLGYQLDNHLNSAHSSGKSFKCFKCKRAFKLKHALYNHLRSDQCTLKCNISQETFRDKVDLETHFIKSEDDQFYCQFCQKTFYQNDHLERHMQSHIQVNLTSSVTNVTSDGASSLHTETSTCV